MVASRHVHLHPVHPKGPRVVFFLVDDSELTRGQGSGGWQIVDRPRRSASTEWLDYSPFTLQMTLMLDGISDQPFNHPQSVESDCARVESWEKPADGKINPPILRVSGPVPHHGLEWVVQTLSWANAIRHPTSGHRLQQTLTLTLLEYVAATITKTRRSPAKDAKHRNETSSTNTASTKRHTVAAGDTLSSVAANRLGDFSRWTDIATLNAIRDPNNLTVGQVLVLPS